MVEHLLGMNGVPDKYGRWILEKSEGNPFFGEEVVRAPQEDGMLLRDETGTRWLDDADGDPALALPDSLQALIVSRIDRLNEETRRTLQLAVLIGRTFFYGILRQIAGRSDSELDGDLAALQQSEFIYQVAWDPEPEYMFRHALTQEAAYKTILRKHRRSFHRQVGEAMEKLFAARHDEYASIIAHHFSESGDETQAFTYSNMAGHSTLRLYDLADAVAHFDSAVGAFTGLAQEALPPEGALIGVYRSRGRAFELVLDYEAAISNYAEMERLTDGKMAPAFRLAAWLAQATIQAKFTPVRDPERAIDVSEKAIHLTRELGDPVSEATAHWNLLLAYTFFEVGQKAIEHGEKAKRIIESTQISGEDKRRALNLLSSTMISVEYMLWAHSWKGHCKRIARPRSCSGQVATSRSFRAP